jgi:flagellar hook-associated protein 2
MRMGGLASGMDTEQIMRDLMRAERMPVDNIIWSSSVKS